MLLLVLVKTAIELYLSLGYKKTYPRLGLASFCSEIVSTVGVKLATYFKLIIRGIIVILLLFLGVEVMNYTN